MQDGILECSQMLKTIHSKQHKIIVERLRSARLEAGLTQADAARRLRVQQSYISRCESGDHRLDVVELNTFARLYKKTLEYFLS